MRELIKEQLRRCQIADLSNVFETTDIFIVKIPRYTKPKYNLNEQYVVKLPDELRDQNKQLKNLDLEYLKIYVSKVQGKQIYVDSIGFDMLAKKDLLVTWSGWLPSDKLEFIAHI